MSNHATTLYVDGNGTRSIRCQCTWTRESTPEEPRTIGELLAEGRDHLEETAAAAGRVAAALPVSSTAGRRAKPETRKTYRIQRIGDQVIADVLLDPAREDGTLAYPLPHLTRHSPDGFEYGYGGSGPADLARSIVGDLQGTDNPAAADYQAVKFRHVARLDFNDPGPFEITEAEIRTTLETRP